MTFSRRGCLTLDLAVTYSLGFRRAERQGSNVANRQCVDFMMFSFRGCLTLDLAITYSLGFRRADVKGQMLKIVNALNLCYLVAEVV